ncbi:MAG: 16S rRNA (cytidine(1402)-2'-O)-methyltransferase [Clostridia bacterium]|nr:16S rRNA (cytidine(1402)-2'-O)-methyltransferase [Clostridia bacterium]
MSKGTLYVVGTPIGNLGDITMRAVETLKEVDLIACEDTRHTRILLDRFEIKKPLVSYYKQKEREGTEKILEHLERGKNVALVTDAGTPCVSDPGAILVKECIDSGYEVLSVPGPSALTTAYSVSGVCNPRFAFIGFLPEKNSDKNKLMEEVSAYNIPTVYYCAPHDLERTISYLYDKLGDRPLTVVKELTKLHETVYKGTLGNIEIANDKGEFILIVEPAEKEKEEVDIEFELKTLMESGLSKSEAVKAVVKLHNIKKNEVYAVAVKL